MTADAATSPLQIADWRRQVWDLYAHVRTLCAQQSAEAAHEHWRRTRDRLFAEHPASPVPDRSGFTGLPTAAYDPAWRFVLAIEPAEPQQILVGTGTDGDVGFTRIGLLNLPQVGSLDVWWHEGYGGGLFVPVRDATAGTSSYGGGRYMIDSIKGADLGVDADGHLVVDLNFAYHPSCTYDPAWACPLPQPGNTVAVSIPVGEQLRDAGASDHPVSAGQ